MMDELILGLKSNGRNDTQKSGGNLNGIPYFGSNILN